MRLPPIDCLLYPSHPLPQPPQLPVAAPAAYPNSITGNGSTIPRASRLLVDSTSVSASGSSSGYGSGYESCSSASASAPASGPTSLTSPLSSSPLSSSSSPTPSPQFPPLSSLASSSSSTTPSLPALNSIIRRVLCRPKIRVVHISELEICTSSIHPRYILTLSSPDDPCVPTPQLMLTLPPRSHTKLLRIEQKSLETEVSVYQILSAHSDVKVPNVLAYDFTPRTLKGTPFILTTALAGADRGFGPADTTKMQRLVERIGMVKSSNSVFGPLYRFSSSSLHRTSACDSWRQAFNLLLEDALRDGEDMLVSLPYEPIRAAFRRLSGALDDVRESRLVLLGLEPEDDRASVLVEEDRGEVAGLIGCGEWVVWGDPLMAKVFNGENILEIGKNNLAYGDNEKDRKMLYLIYRRVLEIVEENYRPRLEERELEARKRLTSILKILQQDNKS